MASDPVLRLAVRGSALLTNPRLNKGTAFTTDERRAFGLTGRLPHKINSIDEQCQRAWDQLETCGDDLAKNTFLQSLRDQNWVLYYALITKHLKELIPIIYTPTEAEAIANYSHLFRRSEGLYLTLPEQDAMEEDFLEQTKGREIDLIVCSDAEQILGIGDQGVGISTAKAAIYTLLGGIDPSKTLSVTLDVGTDNDDLLNDHLYVGWPHKRVRGDEYDIFVNKFVQLVRKYQPHTLLHFEDFGVTNAYRLLEKYREGHAVFNDDVQGTGAVTLACVMSAVGVTNTKLSSQRFVIFGAGSAGLGIARQLRDGVVQLDGLSPLEANKLFYLVDKFGLIHQGLGPEKIRDAVRDFVRPDDEWAGVQANEQGKISLLEVVKKAKPTVLIGCSTKAGAFTEEIVREMKKHVERPIILPLSNPSRLHEVKPQDAMDWTDGQALIATGSPFPACKLPNGKEYTVAECNNALIYPGLGFGAMLAKSRTLTDNMIIAGTQRLAQLSPALSNPDDALLPDFGDAPAVNLEVGIAVAEAAIEEGIAGVEWQKDDVREKAIEKQWKPEYGVYIYDPDGES
ncbi:hypothetical protein PHLGIDRAFT_26030 [Phlebiopsis gigantea 11061_1 CR5-6]|uniref:Malic enzyme n=1 Tax=Phlebiopsis gigantea (strain 11061_1 CR5-6) TaxID=745531 RepID=A0A0C3NFV8_PHLG1|nr:hypothetical protein PHLGIDRAFT_26030 [Phlebiopsis gigantea 11061_1 CR5-6]